MIKVLEKEVKTLRYMQALRKNDSKYDEAWEKWNKLSAKLSLYWKTKKNTVQLMREERPR